MNKEPKFTRFELDHSIMEPIFNPFELIMILWKKPELISMYISFIILSRLKTGFMLTQPQTAELIGISYKFYLKCRDSLEELNLIKIERDRNSTVTIKLDNVRLWGLYSNDRGVCRQTSDPIMFKTFEELLDFTENTGKSLVDKLKSIPIKEGQTNLLHNIYNNISSNNINNNNYKISNNKSNNNTNKVTYPKEDYITVLDAFKKYKGVGLMGPEVSYHMRAIKMMFQAERKPKEIIDFMKWLHDNEKNEETPWVKTWTIWTVQKKIAEFSGGKLEVAKEEYERI
jgi:hypothetical protein